jgi:hypothetical protein
MSERPIFIVGCPRSGTTLLRDLLRSHPRLSFPPESGGLPELYRLHGEPRSRRQARLLAGDLLRSHSLAVWGLDLEPADLENAGSFAAVVSAPYEAWARREGKPRWGDKRPQHVLALPLLVRLFPDAQILHVLRDGRDVALSLAGKAWGQRSAYTAAAYWRRCVEAGLVDGRPLGPDAYHELTYEELVAAPESTLRRVCAFLHEEFDPAVLRPARLPPPGPAQQPARLEGRVDAGRAGRWRTELPAADEVVFESVAGDLLRRLGYETLGRTRPLRRLERARWRTRDAAARLRWRATAWDRVPRALTTCRRSRSLVLRRLGLTGIRSRV